MKQLVWKIARKCIIFTLKIDTEDFFRELEISKQKEKLVRNSKPHHETAFGTLISQETTDRIVVSEKPPKGFWSVKKAPTELLQTH